MPLEPEPVGPRDRPEGSDEVEDSVPRGRRGALVIVAVMLGATAVVVPIRVVYKQTHQPDAPPGHVTIVNYAFAPTTLKVATGTKVAFLNSDDAAHTVTADDDSFDSGKLATDQSYETVVSRSVTYHCDIHPTMQASIEIGG
jgi:plastocyanin